MAFIRDVKIIPKEVGAIVEYDYFSKNPGDEFSSVSFTSTTTEPFDELDDAVEAAKVLVAAKNNLDFFTMDGESKRELIKKQAAGEDCCD